MNIDQAYRFVNSIANKDQRGYLKPSEFNLWAPIAQIEAISDRLGNVKKLDNRFVPPYGYKVNRKIQNELRQILVDPIDLAVAVDGKATYPSDYFYIDSITKPDFTHIEVLDSDQYADQKKSHIVAPSANYPVAVFYGAYILIDPVTTPIRFSYIKYPTDPVWNYITASGDPSTPIYDSGSSFHFSVDRSMHLDICWRILKYAGIPIDFDNLVQLAKVEEATGA